MPMLSVLRQLTATPSVAFNAGQGPLVPVQLGIADTLPGGSTQLSAERQEFWNKAELVYMPDEVGTKTWPVTCRGPARPATGITLA